MYKSELHAGNTAKEKLSSLKAIQTKYEGMKLSSAWGRGRRTDRHEAPVLCWLLSEGLHGLSWLVLLITPEGNFHFYFLASEKEPDSG